MSRQRLKIHTINRSRSGSVVILLLVVLLLVGLLTQQTVRSLWIMRQGQDKRQRIAQANEVLQLGRQLDHLAVKAGAEPVATYSVVVAVGQEFASLNLVGSGVQARWIVKLPVDADGKKLVDTTEVEVSRERALK